MVANLHRIDQNGPAGIVDVLLIHGLGGNARRTWTLATDAGAYWPKWLAEDLPQARIWCAEYPSEPSGWLGDSLPLADSAASILDRMTQRDFGARPIVLIGHSLGGLVAKELMRTAHDAESASWQNIGKHIAGVCFLATPHRGAFLADFLMVVGKLLRFVRSGRILQELGQHDVYIEKLQLWFRKWAVENGLSVHVYREGTKTSGVNAGEKLHRRAGAKIHHRVGKKAPDIGGLLACAFNRKRWPRAQRLAAAGVIGAWSGRGGSCHRSSRGCGRGGLGGRAMRR